MARLRSPLAAGSVAAVLVGTAVLSTTLDARANGRFPEAQAIESVPGDPSTVFLRTTFGLLVSRDAGKRWRWICERALGYEGQWDPPIAATRDGRLWVGLEDGLRVTRDGCEVETVPELDGQTVKDLTTDPRGETVFAITGAPGKPSLVWRRRPFSARFERLAAMDDVNVMTIEVAPSLPSRVYVSGQPYETIRGRIYRSDDGGATFVGPPDAARDAGAGGSGRGADGGAPSKSDRPLPASELPADGPLFIGAIDPREPGRLLVRHLHAKGSEVLVSSDGGRTFRNVLHMASSMFGFAKSADGTTYWAGSGLPEHGVFRSTDRGEHFEPYSKSGVLCLHHAAPSSRAASGTEDVLFVCQNALTLGAPAIGASYDRGKTVLSLARFEDVEGPVECGGAPSGDARADLCAGLWPETKALLSPARDLPAAREDAGRPRRRRDGGASSGGASGQEAGAEGAGPAPAAGRGACGCDVPGHRSPSSGGITDLALLIAGIAPLVLRARGSRGRGSRSTQAREHCAIRGRSCACSRRIFRGLP